MEKQRATEILLQALCLSVPYDPAFVLEVHRDVLKTRLRYALRSSSFPSNLHQRAQYSIHAAWPPVKPIFVDAFASPSCALPSLAVATPGCLCFCFILGTRFAGLATGLNSNGPGVHPTLLLPTLLPRKAFSVQVRDYLDLCVTRLADLKGQEGTGRCKENEAGHDRSPGVGESDNRETRHIDEDCGDPTTREVKHPAVAADRASFTWNMVQEQAGVLLLLTRTRCRLTCLMVRSISTCSWEKDELPRDKQQLGREEKSQFCIGVRRWQSTRHLHSLCTTARS